MNTTVFASAVSIARSRGIERLVRGQPTSDGAGVKLTRVLTQPLQQRLDPFLMLDAFGSDSASDYIGGFPDHPHRGFETVTIMKAGRMRHGDSVGNTGLLEPGSVQWMTAGRGIIHSEMPEQEEGRMAGFQLWVNLAARDKMQPPAYRDVPPDRVPAFVLEGGAAVRVIAGSTHGVDGAVIRPTTEPLVLDIVLPAGQTLDLPVPAGHNAFAYVYGGVAVEIGGSPVASEHMAILRNDPHSDGVRFSAPAGGEAAQILFVAGAPLREPIAQYGPFVMNTMQELQQAMVDFQRGVLAT
ncbi:pirin family protein [uncultured Piscinibacter sp.]|uniref:pirin family protein n=1 Tax=uncultured Piscinibacter sp. TaxID=1131835 RepID=UPI0026343E40|nr:pirin family protein [uncultured Piscinibacter sp.]